MNFYLFCKFFIDYSWKESSLSRSSASSKIKSLESSLLFPFTLDLNLELFEFIGF